MKFSSLYIAQVKQEQGIIERENYNKPKPKDVRQLKYLPEKETAITYNWYKTQGVLKIFNIPYWTVIERGWITAMR